MKEMKILDNINEHDKETVAMALMFKKLNVGQKDYIAAMSKGMIVSNEILEKAEENQTSYY